MQRMHVGFLIIPVIATVKFVQQFLCQLLPWFCSSFGNFWKTMLQNTSSQIATILDLWSTEVMFRRLKLSAHLTQALGP